MPAAITSQLTTRWQISAGEITGWLPPLLFVCAALISAWVLHDARRRRFAHYAVAAWMLATFIDAPVFLPLYLIARMFKSSPANDAATAVGASPQTNVSLEHVRLGTDDINHTSAANTDATNTDDAGAAHNEDTSAAKTADTNAPGAVEPDAAETLEQVGGGGASQTTGASFRLKPYALPLAYACALLAAGAVYFYRDYQSFDAHLARAANARLLNRRDTTIREYRAALRLSDDPHTHKLLAVQLAEDGQAEAALSEFRAAERGGEPDELLAFRIASALDALGRTMEAEDEFRKFLQSSLCARRPLAPHCEGAAARLARTAQDGAQTR
ncbi:MAG TPA: hypothetical protein VF656_09275 [Pyrinomonadaceae bacterium]|jgi:tetratricopeptide (TPR) repeat protein